MQKRNQKGLGYLSCSQYRFQSFLCSGCYSQPFPCNPKSCPWALSSGVLSPVLAMARLPCWLGAWAYKALPGLPDPPVLPQVHQALFAPRLGGYFFQASLPVNLASEKKEEKDRGKKRGTNKGKGGKRTSYPKIPFLSSGAH